MTGTIKVFDERHYTAIEMMLTGKVTNNEIAEKLGLHRNTISKWRMDPNFQNELKKAVIRSTHGRLGPLIESMMDNAIKEGNAAMAKLILNMNDMLTERVSVEDNKQSNTIDLDKLDKGLDSFKTALEDDVE